MTLRNLLFGSLLPLFVLNISSCKRADSRHDPIPIVTGAILKKVTPQYPEVAKAAHIQGKVVLHVMIAEDGTVESLEAISGPDLLRGAAVEAVKQWVYQPYLVNGMPRKVGTTVIVFFQLPPN